jgi:Thrombospondin type 1 domain
MECEAYNIDNTRSCYGLNLSTCVDPSHILICGIAPANSFRQTTQGSQTRTVNCTDSNGTVVIDSLCAGAKPTTSQSCDVNKFYIWKGYRSTCDTS